MYRSKYKSIKTIACFRLFLGLVTVDNDRLLAAFYSLPNGVGKLVFGNGSIEALQARLEAVLEPANSDFPFGRRKKSAEMNSSK